VAESVASLARLAGLSPRSRSALSLNWRRSPRH